ncbi:MAG: 3-isopropylmalate dehydrogenase [Deferribacteraceae bacterium]|nr:3-isopropylmalate dehydrogenase [Deferribacteraceae bacterium]
MHFAVLAGDGIGPEIVAQALKVFTAVAKKYRLNIGYTEALVGGAAYDKYGTPLPKETLELCERCDAILFGAVGGPKWENLSAELQPERGSLLPLRKFFALYANLRPIKLYPSLTASSPLKDSIVNSGVDFVFFRELTGGLYFSLPKQIADDRKSAVDTLRYSVKEIEAIAEFAFEAARARRRILTSIDKANVLMTGVIWRETVTALHEKKYSDVNLSHMYVDNASMQIIKYPAQFDVILIENTFGDILSDEAAALSGSLGLTPSASLNKKKFGLYEPIGGSAPDIAGQMIANPISQILSLALMLRYSFNLPEAAKNIETAVERALASGVRTKDIYTGSQGEILVNTAKMGSTIADNL